MARITGIVSCSCNEVCLCVMNVSWLQEKCKHWVHLALLAKWASPHYPVVGRIDGVECENDLLFWKLWGLLFGCNKISTFFFFIYIFFIMQEVISKHGLLNIEELNSSHPGRFYLQRFWGRIQHRNFCLHIKSDESSLQPATLKSYFHLNCTVYAELLKCTLHILKSSLQKKYYFWKPCTSAMNCKTFKSRAIHNLPVCVHFTVFKLSNRGWNLTAGIWFYSAIRALVRSTCGQQTGS